MCQRMSQRPSAGDTGYASNRQSRVAFFLVVITAVPQLTSQPQFQVLVIMRILPWWPVIQSTAIPATGPEDDRHAALYHRRSIRSMSS